MKSKFAFNIIDYFRYLLQKYLKRRLKNTKNIIRIFVFSELKLTENQSNMPSYSQIFITCYFYEKFNCKFNFIDFTWYYTYNEFFLNNFVDN